jgi:hypothetical protein
MYVSVFIKYCYESNEVNGFIGEPYEPESYYVSAERKS